MSNQNFDNAVNLLYDAALSPERWPQALGAIAVLSCADKAGFADIDFSSGIAWSFQTYGITEEMNAEYLANYAANDVRLSYVMAYTGERMMSDLDTIDEETRTNHAVYRDYLKKYGMTECLMKLVGWEDNRAANFGIFRTSPGRTDDAQHEVLIRLIRHVDRAIKISRRFFDLHEFVLISETLLNSLPEPVAILNRQGQVRIANTAFDQLLATTDPVAMQGQHLVCADPLAQRNLMNALADAHAVTFRESGAEVPVPLTFSIPGSNGLRLQATVAPIPHSSVFSNTDGARALLKLADPATPPNPAVLMQGYKLTPAEARLACELVRGGPLKELAARLDISVNTAKTQLAAVYAKTGASRRADVVGLMAKLPR